MKNDPPTGKIIGAAIEVHRHLGPGQLESAYEECLHQEPVRGDLAVKRPVVPPIHEAQMRTYLKPSGIPTSLPMNFTAMPIKNGIKRFVV